MDSRIKSIKDYTDSYLESTQNPEVFWEKIAKKDYSWIKKWDKVLSYDFTGPSVKWFEGAQLNITENCLDRHLDSAGDKVAIIWEPNDPKESVIKLTYKELHQKVCQASNALKKLGIEKGDRVCIYLPMIPELAISVLACARIGAVHSVVFAGFSSGSLRDRILDCDCKLVITADGSFRGQKTLDLKSIVDDALLSCPNVKNVLLVERTKSEVSFVPNRDVWWHELVHTQPDLIEFEVMDSEDPLFILYTSGSTGKPKGMVHTTAGYMIYSNYTFRNVFQYNPGDIYWCTADIGWITGHSYILYGPLCEGATTLMFEGVPSYPEANRFWQIIEKHQVNIFYTAPTAIRALSECDINLVNNSDLSSLRTLGTVGEPINKEAWDWYYTHIGKEKCPIVDTWWQTETGGIMISSISGITDMKATYATLPMPGIQVALMDDNNEELLSNEASGNLCIKFPWPGMARTIYGDHNRYRETYFSRFPNKYFTGDGSKRDSNGLYRITGRVDDVVIVSGHNLGTAEIENCIDEHHLVTEAAVVGFPHKIKGQGICAFVSGVGYGDSKIEQEILDLVNKTIGPISKPDKIVFVTELPKTRSGKIMRRILRKIASGDTENLGDISTLLNPHSVDLILNSYK